MSEARPRAVWPVAELRLIFLPPSGPPLGNRGRSFISHYENCQKPTCEGKLSIDGNKSANLRSLFSRISSIYIDYPLFSVAVFIICRVITSVSGHSCTNTLLFKRTFFYNKVGAENANIYQHIFIMYLYFYFRISATSK